MNGLAVFGAATLPSSERRPRCWEHHGEWLARDVHLRAEREVRLARQRGAESLLERLTR